MEMRSFLSRTILALSPILFLQLALSPTWAAPHPQRAQLRRELKNAPERWAERQRWIPLPATAKPKSRERGELKVKCVNNCQVVRSVVFEERAGQPGLSISERYHQTSAGPVRRKFGPEEQKAKEAFLQVVKYAQDTFLNRPEPAALFRGAMEGVSQGSETDKVPVFRNAMKGLACSLKDKYTCYMNPTASQEFTANGQRERVGCGVKLAAGETGLVFSAVVNGSPAQRAGLRQGDRLLAINGQAVTTMEQASPQLGGEQGSMVRFEIERAGARQLLEVTRDRFQAHPIQVILAKGGIGVIQLPKFYRGSAKDIKQALAKLEQKNQGQLRGLVFDLRNNPGGSRPEWVAMLNDFLPGGSLGKNLGQGGRLLESFTAQPERSTHSTLPLVVLVNGRSASASERVAGVLKDRHRALLVGEPTFGKDVGQTTHPLADGSSFKVTNVKFHLPSGAAPGSIQPDISSAAARQQLRQWAPSIDVDRHADPELLYAVLKLRRESRATP